MTAELVKEGWVAWRGLTEIILIPPLEPNLQVMVLNNHLLELSQQLRGLLGRQLIDEPRERAERKDRLPAGDGVRANDGVDGPEPLPHIDGAAARPLVEMHVVGVGGSGLEEALADKGSGQALEEALVRHREPVVQVIARGPEGVATGARQLCQTQRRVVGGRRLELDVRVPLRRVVVALVSLVLVSEQLPPLHRADRADLVVAREAKLGRSPV